MATYKVTATPDPGSVGVNVHEFEAATYKVEDGFVDFYEKAVLYDRAGVGVAGHKVFSIPAGRVVTVEKTA